MTPRLKAALALSAVTLIWGWTFVAVKEAIQVVPPLEFVGVRFLLAALVLAPVAAMRTPIQGGGPVLAAGTGVGIALLAGYATQTLGLVYTGATRSGFITGMTVVFVPLIEGFWKKRPPRLDVVLAVAAAALGLVLLTGGLTGGITGGLNPGDVLTIGTAIAFAVHVVLLGRASPKHDALQLTFVQLAVTAVGALAASALFEEMIVPPDSTWMAIAITAFGASAAAFFVMTWAQRHLGPSEAGVILTLEPVFAGLAGYFLLSERLGPMGAVGAALILGASIWVSVRSQAKQTSRETLLRGRE